MIFVGIDVAKDKHDCFILNSEGTVLADVFTIANNRIGFETLLSRIQSCSQGESKIKVGLEATGHYSYNLLGFLLAWQPMSLTLCTRTSTGKVSACEEPKQIG